MPYSIFVPEKFPSNPTFFHIFILANVEIVLQMNSFATENLLVKTIILLISDNIFRLNENAFRKSCSDLKILYCVIFKHSL